MFFAEQLDGNLAGSGIVPFAHLGYDDLLGEVGGGLVWLPTVFRGVRHEPFELLCVLFELCLLLILETVVVISDLGLFGIPEISEILMKSVLV